MNDQIKTKFPAKVNNGLLEDEIEYCEKLIKVIESDEVMSVYPKVREKLNMLKELVADDLEIIRSTRDADAKVGHKTADTSFFGYKTHLAMTEERIITGAVVTSGEKHDGKQLQTLVEQSRKVGIEIKEIIGDAAYSEKDNLDFAKNEQISLIAKLNPTV